MYSDIEKVKKDNYEVMIFKMFKERMIEYMEMILREEFYFKIWLIKELEEKGKGGKNGFGFIKLLEIGGKVVGIK